MLAYPQYRQSKMQQPEIIDSAPGKELIEQILIGMSITAFRELYELRKEWCGGYPLIHEHSTYAFMNDLFRGSDGDGITTELKLKLLPAAVAIALHESDEYFFCALMLLSEVIPDDQILPRPSGFGDALIQFGARLKNGGFHANVAGVWDTIVVSSRCLKPSEPDFSYDEHNKLKRLEI